MHRPGQKASARTVGFAFLCGFLFVTRMCRRMFAAAARYVGSCIAGKVSGAVSSTSAAREMPSFSFDQLLCRSGCGGVAARGSSHAGILSSSLSRAVFAAEDQVSRAQRAWRHGLRRMSAGQFQSFCGATRKVLFV